ncbi:MAG TPA: hypothetical protein VLJ68_09135 [Chitinophagaceae bacterium]|nr:hypothetical protein [Chitinophagaceae bacterium]
MKKYLLILTLILSTAFAAFAQEGDNDDRAGKLQERMKTYIQKRLSLTNNEAERFSPVFLRYLMELRRTHRENMNDKPLLQLRIAEVRLKFRDEFKQIIDEQRANKVFEIQREFERKAIDELKNRQIENRPRRFRSLIQ